MNFLMNLIWFVLAVCFRWFYQFYFLDRYRNPMVPDHRRDPYWHAMLQVRSDGGCAVR